MIGYKAASRNQLAREGPVLCSHTSITIFLVNFFWEALRYVCISYHFSTLRWHRLLKSFLWEVKGPFILHGHYHGCGWPGDTRSQVMSSHGSDLLLKLKHWIYHSLTLSHPHISPQTLVSGSTTTWLISTTWISANRRIASHRSITSHSTSYEHVCLAIWWRNCCRPAVQKNSYCHGCHKILWGSKS